MVTNVPAIIIRPAPRDFSDWGYVHLLILDAFAYMGPRIDPPSWALRLTPKSIQASAESGALLLAYSAGDLAFFFF